MQICYQLILLFANLFGNHCANLCANLCANHCGNLCDNCRANQCANHLNSAYSLLCAKRHLKQVQLKLNVKVTVLCKYFGNLLPPICQHLSHTVEIVHILTKYQLTVRRFELDVKVRG